MSPSSSHPPSSDRPRILVCFAVTQEAAPFRKQLSTLTHLDVESIVTGMGAKNTERSIVARLTTQPKFTQVITAGFAGALQGRWNRGDVLVETPDPGLAKHWEQAGARKARFLFSDRILVTPEEKREAGRRTGCDAVEMESSVVHRLCREKGMPCVTVRVISDAVEDCLPLDFNGLLNERNELPLIRILGAIVKKPGAIPGLMALGKHSSEAARKLAVVLGRGIASGDK